MRPELPCVMKWRVQFLFYWTFSPQVWGLGLRIWDQGVVENQMENGNGSWNYIVVDIVTGYRVEKDPVR